MLPAPIAPQAPGSAAKSSNSGEAKQAEQCKLNRSIHLLERRVGEAPCRRTAPGGTVLLQPRALIEIGRGAVRPG